jgi:hypothetical protein
MKFLNLTLRFAILPAAALLMVSCKNKDAEANPYADNPYYGPSGGGGAAVGGGEYPDVQPTAPAPDYSGGGGGGGGYTAPPPAPSYGGGAPAASTGGGSSHTVAKGDTLFSLARRYNTSVSAIKSANGLSSDIIRIGQTLTIP